MSARVRPGARIGAGTIRVDPRRAIEKLREFQLADPAGWVLEGIRAAVGFGATAIELRGDSDEVWLAWAGPVPEPTELVELFGQLVSPHHGREGRARRLLAIAVNAALGTRPRRVDVYRATADGTERFRYSPALLDGSSREAPLEPERERVEARAGMPAPGFEIHVVRPFDLATLGVFFRGGEPPEIRAGWNACPELPVSISIQGAPRPPPANVLVRLPLEAGLVGYLAVVDPLPGGGGPETEARLEAAELGVVMARIRWSPASLPGGSGPLPLRVYLDAERLPANASRSELRSDEAPVSDAIARADELLPALVEALAAELLATPDEARAGRLRTAALALLAHVVGGAGFADSVARSDVPDVIRPLLGLPLLRDALGRPLALEALGRGRGGVVHLGDAPLGLELEPWVGGIPWMPPGDEARRLLAGAVPPALDPLLAEATAAISARRAFLAHAPVEARVAPDGTQWLAVRIEDPPVGIAAALDDEAEAGAAPVARGELAILDPGAHRPGLVVRVLVEGRPIERIAIPASLPLEAVVESAALRPRADYRAVVADAALRAVLRKVVRAALSAMEALADPSAAAHEPRLGLPPADDARGRDRLEAGLRGAVGSALTLFADRVTRGSPDRRARAALHADGSGLADAPVWPVIVDAKEERLALRAIAGGGPEPVLVVPAGTPPELLPAGGFACVRLGPDDALSFARALGDVRAVHSYEPRRPPPEREVVERMLAALGGPGRAALVARGASWRAVVAWGETRSELALFHRGVRLATRPLEPAFAPCAIAIDHDGIVPTAGWDGVLLGPCPEPDLRALEVALAGAYAEHLLGRARPDLRVLRGTADTRLRASLLAALCGRAPLPDDVLAGVRALPLVERLAPHPLVSIDELDAAGGAEPLLFVEPAQARIDFDPGDFAPIVADQALAQALAALTGREAANAGRRLPELARVALRAAKRAAHAARPRDPVALDGVVLEVPVDTAAGQGRLGIREGERGLDVDVRVDGRFLVGIVADDGPPLRGYLAAADGEIGPAFEGLTAEGRARVETTIRAGEVALLEAMVLRAPELAWRSASARGLVLSFASARDGGAETERVLGRLREGLVFPGLRGERVSIASVARKQSVPWCSFDADWLGPSPDEKKSPLDGPILLLPEGEAGDGVRELVELLAAPRALDDVTGEARELQSRRRVAQGRVPPPRANGPDPRLSAQIAAIAGKSRSLAELGIGEIALAPGTRSEVRVFELGALVARLELDVVPAVVVALESPRVAAELDESKKLPKEALRRLRKKVEGLRASLARRILRDPPDGLEPWARSSLRALALADEGFEEAAWQDARLFETTDERLLSLGELRAEPEARRPLWVTPEPGATARAIDPARPVLRLSLAEVDLLAKRLPVVDGRPALAREAAERAFLARPTVDPFAAPGGRSALGVVRWEGGGASRRGVCVALAPSSIEARALEIVHAGRLLARIEDPAGWPCYARVEDPALVPSASFDGVEAGGALDALRKAVRAAAESAVIASLAGREGALGSLTIDRKLGGSRDGRVQVRGVVHLDCDLDAGGLVIVHPRGTSAFALDEAGPAGAKPFPLGLRGKLLSTAKPSASSEGDVRQIALDAYGKLVRGLARALQAGETQGDAVRDDAALAHVIRAAAVSALTTRDASFGDIRVPCFRPATLTLAEVKRLLAGRGRVRVATSAELESAPPEGSLLLDDGSLASQVLLSHLADRVDRPHLRLRKIFGLDAGATALVPAEPDAAKTEGAAKAEGSAKARRGKTGSTRKGREPAGRRAPAHPLSKLAAALHAMVRRAGLGGDHLVGVVVHEGAARPMLDYDAASRRLWLAGESPVLRGLLPLVEAGDPRGEEALVLLAARAGGQMNRALAPITDADEAGALVALLEELVEP